ncbi:MAG TPA: polymer-forming cytoskeletal protein [Blastocatellia bacterium]|nr:polymer-forming cytoskeletal protein [Blastocatellia bacterium]
MKPMKTNGSSSDSIIGRGVEVTGDLLFAGELQVSGKVTGTLTSQDGTLIIEATGEVDAQVDVSVCVIRGKFRGNVKAKSRIEVYKSARVGGEVATPVLLIEEGAECNAAIMMASQAMAKGQG